MKKTRAVPVVAASEKPVVQAVPPIRRRPAKASDEVVAASGRNPPIQAVVIETSSVAVSLKTVPVFTRAQREAEALRLEIARRDLMARGSKGGTCGSGVSNGPQQRAGLRKFVGARA